MPNLFTNRRYLSALKILIPSLIALLAPVDTPLRYSLRR